eukprot:8218-Heterococcus_DN1.PRE.1
MNWYGWSQWSPATATGATPQFWLLNAAFNWAQQSLTVTWGSNIVGGQTMRVQLWKDVSFTDPLIASATVASDATTCTFTKAALCALTTVAGPADTSYYVTLSVSSVSLVTAVAIIERILAMHCCCVNNRACVSVLLHAVCTLFTAVMIVLLQYGPSFDPEWVSLRFNNYAFVREPDTPWINAGRLYWVDGSAAAMGADSFDIYKNPYGPTSASLLASSVTRSAAQCTAIPGNPAAAQCSYALANNAGLASGYSYYFSVVARNCMAGGSAVSDSSSDTDNYYSAARRRRLQHIDVNSNVSSDVSSDVAHHVAGHLSRACDACNDYAAVVGGGAAVIGESDSGSGGSNSNG